MRRAFLILAACAAMARADEEYVGTVLLHDGSTIVPNMAVPTPAEVQEAKAAGLAAEQAATALGQQVQHCVAAAEGLEVAVAALNGQAIMYGSCVSFGSVSVEASTNATARLLDMNVVSNANDTLYVDLYTWFSEEPASLPVVEHASALPAQEAGGWAALDDLGTVLTNIVVAGVPTECYRSTVGVPEASAAGFFRVKGEAQQTVIGQLLVVYEGFTVNGVQGVSTNIAGVGTFHSGLLMELLEGE